MKMELKMFFFERERERVNSRINIPESRNNHEDTYLVSFPDTELGDDQIP
jgi:hypothetical protein